MATVCEWFSLKTTRTVFAGLASKPVATVYSSLASKLVAMLSSGLASKSVVGFLVEPQNQSGGGFPSLGLKTGCSGLVIWDSKLLGSTVGSFADQPSALLPINRWLFYRSTVGSITCNREHDRAN
jgi:hypothetical protein